MTDRNVSFTRATTAGGGAKVSLPGTLRNGICVDCNVKMEVKQVWIDTKRTVDGEVVVTPKQVNRPVCPICGEMKGQLIVRTTPIPKPKPPEGIKPKDFRKFIKDSLLLDILSSYHTRRVAFANANRPEIKEIPERYRTGEPSPKTLWQAVKAIIGLRYTICKI